MGLDLALGAVILIAAIRGWFKGFLSQAIGIVALLTCVFAANPLRDAARPYVREWLPSMHVDLLDRLLWWSSAVVSLIAISGLAHWLVRVGRRQPYGLVEPNRANQGAGFLFGLLKGGLVACFLAAGFAQFAPRYMPEEGAVVKHAKEAIALEWNARYRPAERIWNSTPVQTLVAHIRANGLGDSSARKEESEAAAPPAPKPESRRDAAEAEPIKTARRPPELSVPAERPLDPGAPTFRSDAARAIERLGIELPKAKTR